MNPNLRPEPAGLASYILYCNKQPRFAYSRNASCYSFHIRTRALRPAIKCSDGTSLYQIQKQPVYSNHLFAVENGKNKPIVRKTMK